MSSLKSATMLQKVTIVGVGLIGGSFALGLKKAGLVNQVVGFGHNESSLQQAQALGVIDDYSLELAEAVAQSDLVVLAVPLGVMSQVMEKMAPWLSEHTLVTDAGSAKSSVIEAAKSILKPSQWAHFVPGHPIAGKEQSGVAAADANLFVNHRVILTPLPDTETKALQQVASLWQKLGAEVEYMQPSQHDEIFAATSHLPHMLAFSLVEMLNEHPELGDVFRYTAGGFRDFTRIASSDEVMWRDIGVHNSKAIAKWLKHYRQAIEELTTLIETQDKNGLYALFHEAKTARDKHIVDKS